VRCPRVRDRVGEGCERIRFSSAILPPYARRSKTLEVLIPILYLKGVSTGDFEEALLALLGKDAGGLSASTIGRLKDAWSDEHTRWSKRDLSVKRYVYFWVDGIHVQARLEDDAQCLLVIIGATRKRPRRPHRRRARERTLLEGAAPRPQTPRSRDGPRTRGCRRRPRLLEGRRGSVAEDGRSRKSGWPRPRRMRSQRSTPSSKPGAAISGRVPHEAILRGGPVTEERSVWTALIEWRHNSPLSCAPAAERADWVLVGVALFGARARGEGKALGRRRLADTDAEKVAAIRSLLITLLCRRGPRRAAHRAAAREAAPHWFTEATYGGSSVIWGLQSGAAEAWSAGANRHRCRHRCRGATGRMLRFSLRPAAALGRMLLTRAAPASGRARRSVRACELPQGRVASRLATGCREVKDWRLA
jgi:hypothetical protein